MSTPSEVPEETPEIASRLNDCRIVVSVSGGRDSAAVSLLLMERGIAHERVFMDTGWEHPATYEYLRGPLTEKLGPIEEIRGKVDFVELVRHKKMFPSRVMRFCTTELKVFPIQRHLRAMADTETREIVNVVGIRRQESQARSKMPEWEFSDNFDVWVWRPLVEWKAADVAAIHERHGLEINPLYGMGATRVGCWPCIHARKSELALVAKIDPARIDFIRELEAETQASGEERDRAVGREYLPRTMFWWHPHRGKNLPIKIDDAIAWARSKRGEWQPAGAGDGCARHGMCSVEPEAVEPGGLPKP